MTAANTSQEQGLAFCFRLDAEGHSKELFQVPQGPDCVWGQGPQPDFVDFLRPQRTQQKQQALQAEKLQSVNCPNHKVFLTWFSTCNVTERLRTCESALLGPHNACSTFHGHAQCCYATVTCSSSAQQHAGAASSVRATHRKDTSLSSSTHGNCMPYSSQHTH